MAKLETKLDDIVEEMKKFNANTVSMNDELREIRSTNDKRFKNSNDPFSGIKQPEEDEDTRKALEQNAQARESMRKNSLEESTEDRLAREDKEDRRKLINTQATTNDYLKALSRVNEEANQSHSMIGSSYDKISGGLANSNFKTLSGFGQMMGDVKNAVSSIINAPSSMKDYLSNKKMKSSMNAIKRDQALLSAQEHELATNDSLNEEKKKKLQDKINKSKANIEQSSNTYSSAYASQFTRKKIKGNKEYKQLDSDDKDMIESSIRDGLKNRIMTETGYIQGSNYQSNLTDEQGSLFDKGNSLNNREPSLNTRGNHSSLLGNGGGEQGTGISRLGVIKGNSVDEASSKKIIQLLMNIPLTRTSNPRTYGEYISGIYDELHQINDSMSNKNESDNSSSSGGLLSGLGSLLSKIGPMIVAAIGPMITATIGAVGTILGTIGTTLGTIGTTLATTLPSLAIAGSAAGGLYVGDKLANAMGMHENGANLHDIGSGINSAFKGDGFSEGMENSQVDRVKDRTRRRAHEEAERKAEDIVNINGYHPALSGITPQVKRDMTKDEKKSLITDYILVSEQKMPLSTYRSHKNDLIDNVSSRMEQAGMDTGIGENGNSGGSTGTSGNITTSSGDGAKTTVAVKSTMSAMTGTIGKDQLTAMQMQARLIASEMMKMNENPQYIEQQMKYYKKQGDSIGSSLFGGN